MVKETFGEMLYCNETENIENFPSPESLKEKVLISTKPPKEYLEENIEGKEVSENVSGTVRNELSISNCYICFSDQMSENNCYL